MSGRNALLEDALVEAREGYATRRPASAARHAQAAEVMPGGNTRSVLYHGPFPFTAEGGEGCRLRDLDGHSYVSMIGEYTAGLFGHSHPAIRAAVLRALDTGVNLTAHNPFEARFARMVRDRFPALQQLRFTNSGTEANLLALGCATIATRRRTILGFQGGYHGGLMTFGLGGPGANPLNVPHPVLLAPYNDLAAAQALARAHAGDLAAIILEPMLGSGGCIPAGQGFLEGLRALAEETGAILIFDEVMTSRLAPGGLQEATGVMPDLTTLGKYVGGGMSFGAFGGRADLMAMFDPGRPDAVAHAGTFNNNTLTMSAGLAALGEIYTPAVAHAHNARGEALRAALQAAAGDLPICVTGRGSMMAFHFMAQAPRDAAEAAAGNQALKELLFLDLLDRGYYIARRGMVALSLMVGEAECTGFVEAFADFCEIRGALVREAVG
ncbi:aspartate aminotransferase family protein [Falsiroseomonas selenitidurans]|uniref:Aminotransferase class III-fold pyridoxal phosphate-dependent enzyme n=1 Tax=Falsiroseomonas selenitidurans TaxID=2716335 RepID=A0ABX1DWP2_9PROT|nr:aminotransferase class III-fold pyridoxal phosphate-dependent enzyme [Falsiroseomonas selenitidurans]NKC29327.1 aminotransferase class III-fold pyridoxal phosphate-dependent enzyme [Falsiroseomonas selenitidurans]